MFPPLLSSALPGSSTVIRVSHLLTLPSVCLFSRVLVFAAYLALLVHGSSLSLCSSLRHRPTGNTLGTESFTLPKVTLCSAICPHGEPHIDDKGFLERKTPFPVSLRCAARETECESIFGFFFRSAEREGFHVIDGVFSNGNCDDESCHSESVRTTAYAQSLSVVCLKKALENETASLAGIAYPGDPG